MCVNGADSDERAADRRRLCCLTGLNEPRAVWLVPVQCVSKGDDVVVCWQWNRAKCEQENGRGMYIMRVRCEKWRLSSLFA